MNDQTVFSKNFFQLLSLPVSYEIDADKLQSNYLKLQAQFHPDRFASSSSQEKLISMQFTSQLNEARTCLLNDVQRGRYVLSLNDQVIPEEQTISDMEFLMQQLEWREKIQTLESNDNPSLHRQFKEDMEKEYHKFYQNFSDSMLDKDWEVAKLALAKLQFMQKILSELDFN